MLKCFNLNNGTFFPVLPNAKYPLPGEKSIVLIEPTSAWNPGKLANAVPVGNWKALIAPETLSEQIPSISEEWLNFTQLTLVVRL